jgi:YHS domain-containing protein
MLRAKRSIPRLSASAALVSAFILAWCGSVAADGRVNTGYFGGVAIKGYDPVAYFTEARAVKGSSDFSHEFLGETWNFTNAEHRDTFAADPVSYAPQYGGYCAGEVHDANIGSGITTNVDPDAWRIIEGKLYLFYRKSGAEWFGQNSDEKVAKADANWPTVAARLAAE